MIFRNENHALRRIVGFACIFILLMTTFACADAPVKPALPPTDMRADSYEIDTEDLSKFTAEGNVVITSGDRTLSADWVDGDRATGEAKAVGNVRLSSPLGTLNTEALNYNLNDESFSTLSGIRAVYTGVPDNNAVLTSNEMTGSIKQGKILAVGDVTLLNKNGNLGSDRLSYDMNSRDFEAGGNVRGRYKDTAGTENELTAGEVTGNALTQVVNASGSPILKSSTGTLSGDKLRYDLKNGLFDVQGNVTSTLKDTNHQDATITANSITGSTDTGDIKALGHVVFKSTQRTFTGETFSYNYIEGTGTSENASAYSNGIYFKGKELIAEKDGYRILDARFTGCNLPKPHYYLSAHELTLKPNKYMSARTVSFHLFGANLFTLPGYREVLTPAGNQGGFKPPTLGVGNGTGLYAGYMFDLSGSPGTQGLMDLRLTANRGLIGGLSYNRIKNLPIILRMSYLQQYSAFSRQTVFLTRLPEVGLRYTHGKSATAYAMTHQYASIAEPLGEPFRSKHPDKNLNIVGELTTGHFDEQPSSVSAQRSDARLVAWIGSILKSDNFLLSPGVSASESHYNNGEDYRSLGFRIEAANRLGTDSYVALGYINNATSGNTPFMFDHIDLLQELDGRFKVPIDTFTLEVLSRYDLQHGGFYDTYITVGKKVHCIEPFVRWRKRTRDFSLGLQLIKL